MGLDQRIDAVGVRRDGDANLSIGSLGQAVLFEALPGCSAIARAIEPAARAAARHAPRRAPCLPQRCKQNVGIMRIESHVDAASVFVLVQNFLPGLTAVGRAEDAALRVRTIGMAEGRNKCNVRIRGIHDDFADGARVAQSHVLPGLAAIQRLVHAVAVRDVAANAGLARPHVE